jgi:replicative DNA helicase
LEVPIVALSQLNRGVEMRGSGGRPKLSDLRESGAIEQDADIVILIHREAPEEGADQNQAMNDGSVNATLIVAKHRNGRTADINVMFQGDRSRFVGLARDM